MKRNRHSAEFKREAARLMIMDGLSAPEVSERLDVKTGLLYRWKREHLAQMDAANPSHAKASPTELSAEIDQLRKQLATGVWPFRGRFLVLRRSLTRLGIGRWANRRPVSRTSRRRALGSRSGRNSME